MAIAAPSALPGAAALSPETGLTAEQSAAVAGIGVSLALGADASRGGTPNDRGNRHPCGDDPRDSSCGKGKDGGADPEDGEVEDPAEGRTPIEVPGGGAPPEENPGRDSVEEEEEFSERTSEPTDGSDPTTQPSSPDPTDGTTSTPTEPKPTDGTTPTPTEPKPTPTEPKPTEGTPTVPEPTDDAPSAPTAERTTGATTPPVDPEERQDEAPAGEAYGSRTEAEEPLAEENVDPGTSEDPPLTEEQPAQQAEPIEPPMDAHEVEPVEPSEDATEAEVAAAPAEPSSPSPQPAPSPGTPGPQTANAEEATAAETGLESDTDQPPARPAGSSDSGPLTRLIHAITQSDSRPAGRIRQVLMVALGVGFLTAAGFVGATWRGRHATVDIEDSDPDDPRR
ncbi:hypothetical protein [Brachybacterium sp. p3-SID957]|uniref:hypothetical protein n=1 Tax=Brachybacterium sp. p3-SID957 TaxID=2916049 RepID=UPI00223B1538|nr:hypothetical protein [Brachybacterium sp. p3-SID957]MCT1775921.1 hypothetical protein [Brachybacterium sp. p3-SID957]